MIAKNKEGPRQNEGLLFLKRIIELNRSPASRLDHKAAQSQTELRTTPNGLAHRDR